MSAGKKVGGILALSSGALSLIAVVYILLEYSVPITETFMTVNLIMSIVVLVGGILGIVGSKVGGGLAIVGGCVWLIGMFLYTFGVSNLFYNVSIFYFILPEYIELVYFGIIEIALAIVGGIVILASGSD